VAFYGHDLAESLLFESFLKCSTSTGIGTQYLEEKYPVREGEREV
jgi:hypothetical protein